MKKNLIAISSFCIATISFSQVTVTNTDIVKVGRTIYRATDSLPASSIVPGGMGNQTWNFSALNNNNADTLIFMNPLLMPNSSMFPSSNLGMQMNTVNTAWVFLFNNFSGLYTLGQSGNFFSAGDTNTIFFSNTERQIKFPANYNDNTSDTNAYQFTAAYTPIPGVDSVKMKHIGWSSYSIDAYGNMTTPLGTFNTIRQSETNYSIDSLWLHFTSPPSWSNGVEQRDSSDKFRWWTNAQNVGFPLVEITFDSISMTSKSANWLLANSISTVVSENSFSSETGIYPNPAGDALNFSMVNPEDGLIKIYDLIGSEIFTAHLTGTITKFSSSGFMNGIYLYKIINNEGEEIYSDKFVVYR